MKKIAIFTSGGSDTTRRLIEMFNKGSRLNVSLVVTDRENSGMEEALSDSGVKVVFLSRETWHGDGAELLDLLASEGIDLIGKDQLKGIVPPSVGKEYEGRLIELGTPEEAPRRLVGLLQGKGAPEGSAVPPAVPPVEPVKSVDQEWAEVLQVNYDPEVARQEVPEMPVQQPAGTVPPPMPGEKPYFLFADPQEKPRDLGPMPSTYMIWAVLSTICCCLIPGIVAIVFASQVSSRYFAGDLEGSRRASRNAQVWIIVSIVLGIVSATMWIPIWLF